jgi:hypothetical protein
MGHNYNKEHLGKATLDSVMKEMAKPRLAAYVRDGIGEIVTAPGCTKSGGGGARGK